MDIIVYKSLDILLLIFHTLLTLFNFIGWIYKPLRRTNLVTLMFTASSWFVLGAFYGWGYCVLTDWHWAILHKLGKTQLPSSYIEYIIERLTPIQITTQAAEYLTLSGFIVAFSASIILNIKDYRQNHQQHL